MAPAEELHQPEMRFTVNNLQRKHIAKGASVAEFGGWARGTKMGGAFMLHCFGDAVSGSRSVNGDSQANRRENA